jgi:hypothetical protein
MHHFPGDCLTPIDFQRVSLCQSVFAALEDETVIDYFNRMAEASLDEHTKTLVAYPLATIAGHSAAE